MDQHSNQLLEFKYPAKNGRVYTAILSDEAAYKQAISSLRPLIKDAYKRKLDTYKANLSYSGEYVDFISIVWLDDEGKIVGMDAHALMRTRKLDFVKGRPTWFAPEARGLGLGSVGQVVQELFWRTLPSWDNALYIRHVNNDQSKPMVQKLGFTEHKKLPHAKWVMRGKIGRPEVDAYAEKYGIKL